MRQSYTAGCGDGRLGRPHGQLFDITGEFGGATYELTGYTCVFSGFTSNFEKI